MAKLKYYAIRQGSKVGIFQDNWDNVRKFVDGYPGAEYKSFTSKDAAEVYFNAGRRSIDNAPEDNTSEINIDNGKDVHINDEIKEIKTYVDGSKLGEQVGYGIGIVILDAKNKEIETISYLGKIPEFLESRQVAGELEAVLYTLQYAINGGYNTVTIFYDYIGIENWAKGVWQANKPVSQKYVHEYSRLKENGKLNVSFVKIKAHTGNKYNEKADILAKQAFSSTKHIENNDGSHTLKGITKRADLEALMEIINTDQSTLSVQIREESPEKVSYLFTTPKGSAVGTYSDKTMNFLIQGRSDSEALYQAVSYAIALLPSTDDVLNVLAGFTDIKLDHVQIEHAIKKLMPNYDKQFEGKNYNNIIYQCAANYVDNTEAFDYTYKITPLFRIAEHLLVSGFKHVDKLDLIMKKKWVGFGSAFTKIDGNFTINTEYQSLFNKEQLTAMEELYDFYNHVRNSYSHGNEDDILIRVIESNEHVREYIEDAMETFDKYYVSFVL